MTAGVTAGERFRSWADIQANAACGAGGLAALGVREDDSVALMLRNDFQTFEVNMAASQLGAYAVPINWHFTPEEAGYILADSGAKVLVAHADLLAQIARSDRRLNDVVTHRARIVAVLEKLQSRRELLVAYFKRRSDRLSKD